MASRHRPAHRNERPKRKSWCAYCAGAATAGLLTVSPILFPSTAYADDAAVKSSSKAGTGESDTLTVTKAEETPAPETEEKTPEPEKDPAPEPEEETPAPETEEKTPEPTKRAAPEADETKPLTITLDDHVVAPGDSVVGNLGNVTPGEPYTVEVINNAGVTVKNCLVDTGNNSFVCELPADLPPSGDYLVVATQGTYSATAQLVVTESDSQQRPVVDASDTMQYSDIVLTGVGWEPNSTVNITLTGPDGSTIVRNGVSVNGDGGWTVTIPTDGDTAPGDWTVQVQAANGSQGSTWMTVEVYEARPNIQCTRKAILTNENTQQTVNLRGYTPDGTSAVVTVTRPDGSTEEGSVYPSGDDGAGTYAFSVSPDLGRWMVSVTQTTATGETNTDECRFLVISPPVIDPPDDPGPPDDGDEDTDPPIDPPDGGDDGDDGDGPDEDAPPTFDPTDDTTSQGPRLNDDLYTTSPLPEAGQQETRIKTQPGTKKADDDPTTAAPEPEWHTVENRLASAETDDDNIASSPWVWALGATGGLGVAAWWLILAWRRQQGDSEV